MNTLETALTWHALDVSTLPILAGTKRPALPQWKQYQETLPTAAELDAWFKGTGYSIAVIAGRGLVIVDFDNGEKHEAWVNSLPVERLPLLNTYRVKTARGYHYYWWCKEPCAEGHDDGVDVKTRGYCLCPPSIHPSGIPYLAQGRIDGIATIERITDMLSDYKPAVWQPIVNQGARDLFNVAMDDPLPADVSFECIRERLSIEDLLGIQRVRNTTHINCPLPNHRDTHASFCIYNDGHWHCYGCNRWGDVITLYSLLNNVSLRESMKELMRKVGYNGS